MTQEERESTDPACRALVAADARRLLERLRSSDSALDDLDAGWTEDDRPTLRCVTVGLERARSDEASLTPKTIVA